MARKNLRRLSAKDFDALAPKLGRLTVDTVRIAREVLVSGRGLSEVAVEHGISRQRVNDMVSRVMKAAHEAPRDWVRVEVWLPPDLAERVKKMEADAKAKVAKQRTRALATTKTS